MFAVGCRDAGDLARFTVGRALAVAQGVGGFDDAARCVVFVAGFAAQRVLAFGELACGVVLVAADAACGVHGFDGAAQCVVAGLRA